MYFKVVVNQLCYILICFIILNSFSASVFADTYSYDANGNMVQDSGKGQCYVYNEANQLKEVNNCAGTKIAQYYYDYTGRRIKTVEYNGSSNITTYYPFPDYETVLNGSQTKNTSYYFANGERVARKDADGSLHYYSGDHLGSTSVVTDSAGNLEEKTRYQPFGDTLSHTGVNAAKHLYTGQEKDTETGLYYYNARYYNPSLMHFTQPDTYISFLYNPQDLNAYSYVQNNPIRYTDPQGHQTAEAVVTTGAAYAAGVIGAPEIVIVGAVAGGLYCVVNIPQAINEVAKSVDDLIGLQKPTPSPSQNPTAEENPNVDLNPDSDPNLPNYNNPDANLDTNGDTDANPDINKGLDKDAQPDANPEDCWRIDGEGDSWQLETADSDLGEGWKWAMHEHPTGTGLPYFFNSKGKLWRVLTDKGIVQRYNPATDVWENVFCPK